MAGELISILDGAQIGRVRQLLSRIRVELLLLLEKKKFKAESLIAEAQELSTIYEGHKEQIALKAEEAASRKENWSTSLLNVWQNYLKQICLQLQSLPAMAALSLADPENEKKINKWASRLLVDVSHELDAIDTLHALDKGDGRELARQEFFRQSYVKDFRNLLQRLSLALQLTEMGTPQIDRIIEISGQLEGIYKENYENVILLIQKYASYGFVESDILRAIWIQLFPNAVTHLRALTEKITSAPPTPGAQPSADIIALIRPLYHYIEQISIQIEKYQARTSVMRDKLGIS